MHISLTILKCTISKECINNIQILIVIQISIKEEDRLASVIADIDEDVRIVPRAAFVKSPTGEVISNRSFEGI